jgi:hypothetical protein
VKLFLKNKSAKNHCEIQVRTILKCALYLIKYGIPRACAINKILVVNKTDTQKFQDRSRLIATGGKALPHPRWTDPK